MAKSIKKWNGSKPENCDVCRQPLAMAFVDGKTLMGPWALMCRHCHDKIGVGLGAGRGQLYELDTLYKIED